MIVVFIDVQIKEKVGKILVVKLGDEKSIFKFVKLNVKMGRLCFKRFSLRARCVFFFLIDNIVGVYVRRGGFSRQKQDLYFLFIVISDGGISFMSSINIFIIKVCGCDVNGALFFCNVEVYILNVGLSIGALIVIFVCIVIFLGKGFYLQGGFYNQIFIFEIYIFFEVRLVFGDFVIFCGYNLR